jgi:hypothetical protein
MKLWTEKKIKSFLPSPRLPNSLVEGSPDNEEQKFTFFVTLYDKGKGQSR